ncbi:MAG: hypothetical protein AAGG56_16085, partial [Pseudomonadota bacterium]
KFYFIQKIVFKISIIIYLLFILFFYSLNLQDKIWFSTGIGAPTIFLITISPFLFLLIYLTRQNLFVKAFFFVSIILIIFFKPIGNEISTSYEESMLSNPGEYCNIDFAACFFESWLYSRADLDFYRNRNVPYPVYLVSASGGGIYAAAHTDALLRKLTQICPKFAAHLFAISSVSGGSFGAAVFASDPNLPWQDIEPEACGSGKSEPNALFYNDFLSPIAAAFAFGNIPQLFVPLDIKAANTGRMLADVFNHHVSQRDFSIPQSRTLTYHLNKPAILFNVADSVTGNQKIIAPFSFETEFQDYSDFGNPFSNISPDISMADSASLSSRFPILTPPTRFSKVKESTDDDMILLDGGYIDNSGSSVLRVLYQDLLRSSEYTICKESIKNQKYCGYIIDLDDCNIIDKNESSYLSCIEYFWENRLVPVTINVLQLRSDEEGDDYLKNTKEEYFDKQRLPTIIEPIRALLNARSARSLSSRFLFQYDLFGETACHDCEFNPQMQIYREHIIDVSSLEIPLSWTLADAQYDQIWDQVGHPNSCYESNLDGVTSYNSCIFSAVIMQLRNGH